MKNEINSNLKDSLLSIDSNTSGKQFVELIKELELQFRGKLLLDNTDKEKLLKDLCEDGIFCYMFGYQDSRNIIKKIGV